LLNTSNFVKLKDSTVQLALVCTTNAAAFAQQICWVWASKRSQKR